MLGIKEGGVRRKRKLGKTGGGNCATATLMGIIIRSRCYM